MSKLIFSFSIIFLGLILGYITQHLVIAQIWRLPLTLDKIRILLQRTALLFVLPVTVTGAIWVADFSSVSIAALPLIGAGAILLGGALAWVAANTAGYGPRQIGALVPCGSFSNLGAVGTLICYVYLGEKGFALTPIYRLFEDLIYYAVGFPIAKYCSTVATGREMAGGRIAALAKDPYILVTLSSILVGGLLNVSGLARPGFMGPIIAIFIPLGTGLLMISIGLAMRFKSVKTHLKACLLISAIKFIAVPLVAIWAAWWGGYGHLENGLPLKVVMILSSMPVAFTALIPPSIYDLDLDLANACWLFTTAALLLVLPLQLMLIRLV